MPKIVAAFTAASRRLLVPTPRRFRPKLMFSATDFEHQDAGEGLRLLTEKDSAQSPEIGAAFREAGRNMGYAVDALLSMLDPEQILLTGTAHRQPDFIEGIKETLAKIRPNDQDWPIKVSRVTSEQAAIRLGFNAFVYSPSLDIEQLKNAQG